MTIRPSGWTANWLASPLGKGAEKVVVAAAIWIEASHSWKTTQVKTGDQDFVV